MRRRVVASIGPTPCKFADRIVVVLELSLCDFSAETHVLFCLLVALLSYCYDVSSGGTLVTAEPFMGGAVELAGRLCAGTLSIDKASILENLSVGYSGITAQLTGAASIVNPFLEPASERLSVLLENDLIATVEPTVRPVIGIPIASVRPIGQAIRQRPDEVGTTAAISRDSLQIFADRVSAMRSHQR